MLGILKQAPAGAYVSTGSERSFMGAANSAGTDALWVLDRDPFVIHFARLNTLLLKHAHNREHYRYLRVSAGMEEWQRLVDPKHPDYEVLSDARHFAWWEEKIRSVENFRDYVHTQAAHDMFDRELPTFKGVNYLFEDAPFLRLQKLAREGKIYFSTVDLTNAEALDDFVAELKRLNQAIAVFDGSNAWQGNFMGEYLYSQMLYRLLPATTAKSLIISTRWQDPYGKAFIEYMGLRFKDLIRHQDPELFARYFEAQIMGLRANAIGVLPLGSCEDNLAN
jgi:hypothetical protein